MGRALIMFAGCLLVVTAMAVTLFWFFRRLRQIELAFWGGRKDTQGLRAALERRRIRKAESKAGGQHVERPA